MWGIYVSIGLVCLSLGFVIGILFWPEGKEHPIGVMNVVEWSDGTYDLLLQLEDQPSSLADGQEVMVKVHKTRR